MTGTFQSEPIEGVYGIFRQDGGGNFYIAFEQILSSMTLLRIKFFDKLDMPYTDDHTNDNDECCHAPLTDKELEFFEIIPTGLLSEKEQATLHYISGYVASKHDIGIAALEKHFKASEFTDNVSRGKLKHPTACLFELSNVIIRLLQKCRRQFLFKSAPKSIQHYLRIIAMSFQRRRQHTETVHQLLCKRV